MDLSQLRTKRRPCVRLLRQTIVATQKKRRILQKESMEIYDSRYFRVNKKIVKAVGLWPYEDKTRNFFIRSAIMMSMLIMTLPQFIRLYKFFGKDLEKMLENMLFILYLFGISIKVVTANAAEDKMKIVYENTATDFQTIVDEEERNILFRYGERGRKITVVFIIYMCSAVTVFTSVPMTPILLDKWKPLNQSRPKLFICNGDFFVDSDEHYGKIYLFEWWTCALTVVVLCSVDPLYAAIVEHCLALFAIVRYRLELCTKISNDEKNMDGLSGEDRTFSMIVKTIQLHNKIIKFTTILESSYTQYFLLEMGVTILLISTVSVMILIKLHQVVECIRYILFLLGVLIHMFYLTWPSQKMIDYSSNLYQDTYLNEWYDCSIKCQNLLKFMTLRCSQPCQLTAGGGIYVMNFTNFAAVVKTSASYITVFSSFR